MDGKDEEVQSARRLFSGKSGNEPGSVACRSWNIRFAAGYSMTFKWSVRQNPLALGISAGSRHCFLGLAVDRCIDVRFSADLMG